MRVGDLRAHEEVLGFRPEDAVRWLSPRELWRAGVKVVLSSVFASYADKREVQEALEPTELKVPPARGSGPTGSPPDGGSGSSRSAASKPATVHVASNPSPRSATKSSQSSPPDGGTLSSVGSSAS